ncbi:MAG TPA: glutaredoxin domain-containing protein [Polyangiales bacterium]|jgi:glutaredoxin-related protein|nr:glutaredoxin domain-containing protein [Polyangiales bacterium]
MNNPARKLLPGNRIAPAAAQAAAAFHSDIVAAVEQAVQGQPVVVVGMAQNPVVKKARKALDDAGIRFTYLEYGSYLAQWKQRLAIKLWSGWPTFPQIYVRGVLIGGHQQLAAALSDGSFKRMLEQTASPDQATHSQ